MMPPSGMLKFCGTMPGGGTSEKLTVMRSPLRRTEKEPPAGAAGAGAGAVPVISGDSAAWDPGNTKRSGGFGSVEQPASNASAPTTRPSPAPRFTRDDSNPRNGRVGGPGGLQEAI